MVALVQIGMSKRKPFLGIDTIRSIHYQIEGILKGVVFKDISVLPCNPNMSVVFYVKTVQVRELLGRKIVDRQFVVFVLFAIVTVYTFEGKKPHVTFQILFNGNDSSAAQSIFRFQITVELCIGMNYA
jgi:hypothetical protein